MFKPPSGPPWEELVDFLDFSKSFALGVLIFPSLEYAEHWKAAIDFHLQSKGGGLFSFGPYDAKALPRLSLDLLDQPVLATATALWVPLYHSPMSPDAGHWSEKLFQGLGGVNQARNLITRRHRLPLLLAGTHELLRTAPEAAPDLWSIRRLVLEVPAETRDPTMLEPLDQPQNAAAGESLFLPQESAPDPDEMLALAEQARQRGDSYSFLRFLLRSAQGFAARSKPDELNRTLDQIHQAASELSRQENAPQALNLIEQAGNFLFEAGRYAEAEPLMRRVVEIDEKSLGGDHPNFGADLNNFARLLLAMNRLAEAEPLMRRALDIGEKTFGGDHPNVGAALNNLAGLLMVTNRMREAERLYRRALAIAEASLGKDHPDVANCLNNLAQLLKATKRLTEAETLVRRALAINEASFGKDHPNVAISLNNLAQLLKATNRLAEAEPLYRRALAIDEASLGKDHPSVATALSNLTSLLQATNRLTEAEPLMRRALAIDEASFGKEHPEVATDINNLAILLQALNRLLEAEPLMRRAVTIFLKSTAATGHPHMHLFAALHSYAGLCQKMKLPSEECVANLFAMCGEAGLDEAAAKQLVNQAFSR